jgi:hypothetical protein
MKPLLVLDFDGVVHSYVSGWKGAADVGDGPVEGAFDFIDRASKHFRIAIYSSRSAQPGGIDAMKHWFKRYWFVWGGLADGLDMIEWPTEKPPAFLTIDDRALLFEGTWPDPLELLEFKPWNKKGN